MRRGVAIAAIVVVLFAGGIWAAGPPAPGQLWKKSGNTLIPANGEAVAIGTALSFTALSSAPASPVTGGIYLANNEAAGWDPCSIAGTTDYFVLYTGSAYVALWDISGNILVSSIPVINWTIATLSDTTTPHTLTSAELKGTVISNVGAGEAHTFNAPAREAGWNFILLIEAAQNVILTPNGTEAWYLNGLQMAAGEAIVNEAATVGESITCYSTAAAVYCESKYTDWKEDTPP